MTHGHAYFLFFLFFSCLLITKTVHHTWQIELPSPVPAEDCNTWSVVVAVVVVVVGGGLHRLEDVPLHVVAGAVLQDVLHCLVLQAVGVHQ